MKVSVRYSVSNPASVWTGAAGGEESQQGGVQGGEGATGEADAEPANEHPRPEALVAE